jgi:type I restriction enzyme S subunit
MGNNWSQLRLGNACTKIGSGATPRGGGPTYLLNGPYALIRSQNVYNDHFEPQGLAYISKEQADRLANVVVEEGDVLLNITGDSVPVVAR